MNASSFDRRILIILAGLLVFLGGVILLGQKVGLSSPQLEPKDGQVGAYGPVGLAFPEPMQKNSVESRISFSPVVKGRFTWGGNQVQEIIFWPDQPLIPGQVIDLHLAAGAMSQSGLKLTRDLVFTIRVRLAEVVFLSPTEKPELWRALPGGDAPPRQLTFTGGAVSDYDVSRDGNKIVYSARNDQNGLDLWEIGRSGGEPRLLLPCQTDICTAPAYSPDGSRIAYSRRQAGATTSGKHGAARIWLFDTKTFSTDALYIDPNVYGDNPVWSPDGKYLAFYDDFSAGIRVLDVAAQKDQLVSSQLGLSGSWSPDSKTLLFIDAEEMDSGPYIGVFSLDIATHQIQRRLGEEVYPTDYSIPEWSPGSSDVAVAMRFMNGSQSKQIWLMQLDGSQRREITQDQSFTNGGYHWDPNGNRLVFQRLELGSSDFRPQLVVWNRSDDSQATLAEDAYQPGWLP